MASAYSLHPRYLRRASPRRRAVSLALALGLVALLILALLRLGAPTLRAPGQRSLSTFTVMPDAERSASRAKPAARRAAVRPVPRQPQPPQPPQPVPPPPPVPNPKAPAMIVLSREEMASADIGRMERAAAPGDGADGGGDTASAGTGPNGQRLYAAEWYREPPPNVLQLYLPRGAPAGSWATIACRTIERYHVDSCQQLDESPPGSGLSRAVRLAAWQFLVRPPRLNGKPLVGAWVRIRFDFTAEPTDK